MKKKYWQGSKPIYCNVCMKPLKKEFIDGAIKQISSWAIMCSVCHKAIGLGLGTGLGQRYDLKTLEKLEG